MKTLCANWIYEENLFVVLDYLAVLAEYKIDEDDWIAIEYGTKSDSQKDIEFSYGFYSKNKIEFKILQEAGESNYEIVVYGPENLSKAVETLFSMAQLYELKKMT